MTPILIAAAVSPEDCMVASVISRKVIVTMPLLEGTDGVLKMSKSFGNYIGINESAGEMFGKIMSISDKLMMKYYELLTEEDRDNIKTMHPKEAKERLAELIVASYHGDKKAQAAREEFQRVFSNKELPDDIPLYKLSQPTAIVEIMLNSKISASGNEARRLIKQGAVEIDGTKIITVVTRVKD
jgi:tyrosyl-tRNA synthetase